MRFHVTFEAYQSIVGNDVANLRKHAGASIQRVMGTWKVGDHGVFQGKRGGFMIIEADSDAELFNTIGDLVDSFTITVTPITSFETLSDYFRDKPFSWG